MSERPKPPRRAIVDKPSDYADWWDRPGIIYEKDVDPKDTIELAGRDWKLIDGKVVLLGDDPPPKDADA